MRSLHNLFSTIHYLRMVNTDMKCFSNAFLVSPPVSERVLFTYPLNHISSDECTNSWISQSQKSLVNSGCYNKMSQTWLAYTAEIYFFRVLEVESQRSGCQYVLVLMTALFLAYRGSHCFLTSRESSLFLFLESHSPSGLGAHPYDFT